MFILTLLRRLFDAVSTMVLVTAVAAFVWLYAEQKTVRDQNKLEFEVGYGTPEQQKNFVILAPGAPRKISVSFRSSNKVADDIRAKLAKGTAASPFSLPLEIDSGKDKQTLPVSVRERLEKTLFLNTATSNVQVEQNPQVDVTIEKLATIELPLETDSGTLPVEWNPKPATVAALLPAHIAETWKREKNRNAVKAIARLDKLSLTNVKPGEKVTRQIAVEIPALDLYLASPGIMDVEKTQIQEHLTLSPAFLQAAFTLDNTVSEDLRIARAVPLTISAPPSILNDWSFSIPVEDEKFLKDLRLTCSPETKDRIQKNEEILAPSRGGDAPHESPLVWAVVRVVSTPPASGILTLPLEVMLPAGAAVSPSVILPKTITVKATRRNP